MKLRTVQGDGSDVAEEDLLEIVIVDKHGNAYGEESPVITCRYIGELERQQIERKAERFRPGQRGKPRERYTDWLEVINESVRRAILKWEHVEGADGAALVCNDETKVKLPLHWKSQIVEAVTDPEGDISSASFRESADLV